MDEEVTETWTPSADEVEIEEAEAERRRAGRRGHCFGKGGRKGGGSRHQAAPGHAILSVEFAGSLLDLLRAKAEEDGKSLYEEIRTACYNHVTEFKRKLEGGES